MKNKFLVGFSLVVFLIFGFSSSGAAYTMTEVGDPDNLIAVGDGTALSADAAEKEFFEKAITEYTGEEYSVSDYFKWDSENLEILDIKKVEGTTTQWAWYFGEGVTPDYFMVKVGTGGTTLYSHYLFENVSSLEYGSIDETVIYNNVAYWLYQNGNFTLEEYLNGLQLGEMWIERISHVSRTGGTPVPEPGMVILLGIGLLGLAFYNRKRLLN